MLSEETADQKLQLSCMIGAGLATSAVVISILCSVDPFGGAAFDLDTLRAALLGGLAAAPLGAFRQWSWSKDASKVLPAVDDVHGYFSEVRAPQRTMHCRCRSICRLASHGDCC